MASGDMGIEPFATSFYPFVHLLMCSLLGPVSWMPQRQHRFLGFRVLKTRASRAGVSLNNMSATVAGLRVGRSLLLALSYTVIQKGRGGLRSLKYRPIYF